MFNLVIMNNKSKKKIILIFVVVFCMCCCLSSIISGGSLFLKSDKKDVSSPSKKDDSSPSKQYTLRSAKTGFKTNGEGKVYYLDRHNVSCNIDSLGGINGFHLKTDNDNATMQYEYKCLNGIDTSDGSDHNTTPDVDGDPPHSVYLDRHTIDCANKPITQFKLHRNSAGDKIHYKYHCAKGPNSSTCRDVTTEYNDQGGGNVIYLDRHAVNCNEGEYLSKFRLDADDNDTTGKYRYEYKCCKP
jgi:hypothetical protein